MGAGQDLTAAPVCWGHGISRRQPLEELGWRYDGQMRTLLLSGLSKSMAGVLGREAGA